MQFRQLEAFRAVMIHGSITKGAEAMGITQPAVTRLIGDLEAAVGFALFHRTASGVVPTPEAVTFREELERSFGGLDRLRQAAGEIRDLRRGHVRIAAMPAVAAVTAPSIVGRFKAGHPDIQVTLDVHTSPRLVDLVAAGRFDLGFAHLPRPRPDITVVASYRMACVVAMPPGHPLAGQPLVTPRDLAGVPMVALSHHTVTARHVDQMLLAADIVPDIRVECQPSYAACALVVDGVGISIVDPLTPTLYGPDRLVTRPFEPTVPFDFRVMRQAGDPPSKAAARFTDLAVSVLDGDPVLARQTGDH